MQTSSIEGEFGEPNRQWITSFDTRTHYRQCVNTACTEPLPSATAVRACKLSKTTRYLLTRTRPSDFRSPTHGVQTVLASRSLYAPPNDDQPSRGEPLRDRRPHNRRPPCGILAVQPLVRRVTCRCAAGQLANSVCYVQTTCNAKSASASRCTEGARSK